jgi:hypothetical protein
MRSEKYNALIVNYLLQNAFEWMKLEIKSTGIATYKYINKQTTHNI